MRLVFLIIGIGIICLGLMGGGTSIIIGISLREDPSECCLYSITWNLETVNLKEGTYDIWYEKGVEGDLTIKSEGSEVEIEKPSMKESIKGYKKYGTFEVNTGGRTGYAKQHTVFIFFTDRTEIFITEPIHIMESNFSIYGGLIFGIMMIAIGSVLVYKGLKGQKKKKITVDSRSKEEMEYETLYGKTDEQP